MRMNPFLIFVFSISISLSAFGQESDSLSQVRISEDIESEPWYRSPSLRWNVTALANFWFPAASVVYEYPFNDNLAAEVELGLLLPYAELDFRQESFHGFRLRVGPKIYLIRDENNLLYLRPVFKYDYAKAKKINTLVDPSQSFTEFRLLESRIENIGFIMFAGYKTPIINDRMVIDVSFGIGGTRYTEEIRTPNDGSTVRVRNNGIFDRDQLEGSLPVVSVNFQIGYIF